MLNAECTVEIVPRCVWEGGKGRSGLFWSMVLLALFSWGFLWKCLWFTSIMLWGKTQSVSSGQRHSTSCDVWCVSQLTIPTRIAWSQIDLLVLDSQLQWSLSCQWPHRSWQDSTNKSQTRLPCIHPTPDINSLYLLRLSKNVSVSSLGQLFMPGQVPNPAYVCKIIPNVKISWQTTIHHFQCKQARHTNNV